MSSRRAVAAEAAPSGEDQRADYAGLLALVEALRGRLRRAAELAGQAALVADEQQLPGWNPDPAALIALAWVHLERNDPREARSCLKQADALGVVPDKLIGAVASLAAANSALAEGRTPAAAQIISRARSGWPVPAWLDQQLSLVESRAFAAAGDLQAALAAAGQADAGPRRRLQSPSRMPGRRPGTAITHGACSHPHSQPITARQTAYACKRGWWTPGSATRSGDRVRGRRSLRPRCRWLNLNSSGCHSRRRVAGSGRCCSVTLNWLTPTGACWPRPFATSSARLARVPRIKSRFWCVESLTEREREVLQLVSGMLNTAEVASEMYISVNTVKTHLRSIYRKLGAAHRAEAVRRARQLQLI